METNSKNTIERLGVKYGVLMTLALVGYFLLMKAVNLEQNLELRVFNLIILSSFVLMAIDKYKKKKGLHLTYLKGVGLGLLTSVVGVFVFATLVLLYVTILDPAFMEIIKQNEPFGSYLNPLLVSIAILIEGTASGFIATFAIMQYYKVSHLVSIHGE
ncbi:hypothetical protein OKW21_000530 [Catalinimonas alkaloidigena]|uniref:DUF4199 domain-containing protein n=1 Tax=Catalinimonas alkaloidigena TaxID=1075417 RepID=UPI002406E5DA|nr:DUF4199 domain-containing protein [Catalinimonas alkaloidigena]MDF9795267.1 hypothetical protein [Catalinimonas alkaloidigena]